MVYVSIEGGAVQEIETLVVGEEGIGAVLEEEVHDVVVAPFCGPEDWCCDCVAAFCVYGGARLEEEVAEGVVVVYCGPLYNVSVC